MNPLSVLDVVPGWVWAGLLAASLAQGCELGRQRDGARLDAQTQKTIIGTLNTSIERNKDDAARELAAQIERTRLAEKALRVQKEAQEIRDVQAKTVSDDLRRQLRTAAGPAGRLRDPHAVACVGGGSSSGSAKGGIATTADAGATDGASAGGLLSAELTEFLLGQAATADAINDAYASCKNTLTTERAAPK